jgi:cellulose synthase/poly-beta-1,6-N-acetylglucosamine synthase-like glycosyltransferase
MQIKTAFSSTSRALRVHLIARFCVIGLVLVLGSGCDSPTESETQASVLSAADLGATARTDTGKANRARAEAEFVTPKASPIPLPDGVVVGHSPPHWWGSNWDRERAAWIKAILWILYSIVALICVYAVRHYWFTYNRLFGKQRHTYLPIDVAQWPSISVLIPCHNEERVVASILEALLKADYPQDKLQIVPVNDRSTDATREIIDRFAASFPDRVVPVHRTDGKPGKAAALQDALAGIDDDVILVFDADYLPGRDLIKRLAAPFLDPQVGAVMGRVVPVNTPRNLLTRLLDLERAGGYQVDQQARMNLRLIAQYGGTVGGVRVSALDAVGGWREDSLADDTDITFRLVLGGWKIAYSNRYECYEEVPETWPVRIRQIMRWARGHTDAARRYMPGLATQPRLTLRERVDGALLLGTYMMSPILLLGWFLAILAFYLGANPFLGAVAIFSHLDGTERRIRILPLVLGGFLVSLVSTSRAVLSQLVPRRSRAFHWDKTERYRANAPVPVFSTKPAAAPAVHSPHTLATERREAAQPITSTKPSAVIPPLPPIPTTELAPAATHEPRRRERRPADAADRPAQRSTTGHQIRVPGKPTS